MPDPQQSDVQPPIPQVAPGTAPQVDWQNDPDFHALPLVEKDKALQKLDPDYAGLPPQERSKALNAIQYGSGTQFEKERAPDTEGLLSHTADVLGQQVKGAAGMLVRPWTEAAKGYSDARAAGHGVISSAIGGAASGVGAAMEPLGVEEGLQKGTEDTLGGGYQKRRAEGYGPVYSATAPTVAPLVGVNLPATESAAAQGHTGDVMAQTAVPALEAGAAELKRIPAVSKAIGAVTGPVQRAGEMVTQRALEPFSLGLTDAELLKKGISPRAKSTGYDAAIQQAKGDIVAQHQETPIRSVKDLHEAIPQMQRKIESQEMEPVAQRHADEPLDQGRAAKVKQAVLESAGQFTEEFDPKAAEETKQLADKFGKARTIGDLMGGPKGGLLGYINAHLDSYFSKYPAARRSELMSNPETAAWESARLSLRGEVLDQLEQSGETGIRAARQRWGALNQIGDEVDRRVNVADRAKPVSLSRLLGVLGAPLTMGKSIVLGEAAHYMNQPDTLVRRGVASMAKNPEAIAASKSVGQVPDVAPYQKPPAPAPSVAPARRALPPHRETIIPPEPRAQRLLPAPNERAIGMLDREPGDEEEPLGGVRTQGGLILDKEGEIQGRIAAPKESIVGEPEPGFEKKATAKVSKEPAYDSLATRDQAWISDWAKSIKGLPKSLQDSEMEELNQPKYGPKGTTSLRERIAKRYVEQTSKPKTIDIPTSRASGGANGEAGRAEADQAQRRHARNLKGRRPDRQE